jgi:hypothetical protein
VTAPDFAALAAQHTLGDDPIPDAVLQIAAGRPVELAWRNELGGLTFRIGETFVKWNPRSNGHRSRARAGPTRVDLEPAPGATCHRIRQ